MDISTYFSNIFTDVNQNYPHLIEVDQISNKPSYVGCGSTSSSCHIYLVLICTLPLFKKLEEAQTPLLEMFGYSRSLENQNLDEGLSTTRKIIQFFSKFSTKYYNQVQGFVFKPEHLTKLITIAAKKEKNFTSIEVVYQLLKKDSKIREILHHKTIKRVQNAKIEMIDRNWGKAMKKLRTFYILSFISLIWKNLMIRLDTQQLIKELDYWRHHADACIGRRYFGNDVISHAHEIKVSGKI